MLGRSLFPGTSSWGQMEAIARWLGVPSAEDVSAFHPDQEIVKTSMHRLQGKVRPWPEIFQTYATMPDALEIPAQLLVYKPSARSHPATVFASRFFQTMPQESYSLPAGIFKFTDEELVRCTSRQRMDILRCFQGRDERSTAAPITGVRPASSEAAPKKARGAPSFAEGARVEVASGKYQGVCGTILKMTSEKRDGRNEVRYRIQLERSATWVDAVRLPSTAANSSAVQPPSAAGTKAGGPPAGVRENDVVEITAGEYAGKKARVLKVSGEGKEMRWRVQLDGGPATWVDDVKPH